jgi:hypothetical protein
MTAHVDRRLQALSHAAIVVLPLLVYWLDRFTILLRRQSRMEFTMPRYILFSLSLPAVFAVLALFLAWLLLVRLRPAWTAILLCLLAGAGYVILVISLAFPGARTLQLLESTGLAFVSSPILELGAGSLTLQMGAFFLVLGLVNLVRMGMENKAASLTAGPGEGDKPR